jgi:hypothetical protein
VTYSRERRLLLDHLQLVRLREPAKLLVGDFKLDQPAELVLDRLELFVGEPAELVAKLPLRSPPHAGLCATNAAWAFGKRYRP